VLKFKLVCQYLYNIYLKITLNTYGIRRLKEMDKDTYLFEKTSAITNLRRFLHDKHIYNRIYLDYFNFIESIYGKSLLLIYP